MVMMMLALMGQQLVGIGVDADVDIDGDANDDDVGIGGDVDDDFGHFNSFCLSKASGHVELLELSGNNANQEKTKFGDRF